MEKIDKDKDKRNSRVDLKKKISTRIGIGIRIVLMYLRKYL